MLSTPKENAMLPTARLVPLACAGLLAACASMTAQADPAMVADGVLVGPNGMTLYTFDRDAMGSGKSACNGPCATNWPPLMAAADAMPTSDWTIVMRDDGGHQWAYRGKPVYYWAKDAKPGDRTGDNFNNMWHLVRP
jgi:predicted lipoprotein with Yx(FWY)xxD motif